MEINSLALSFDRDTQTGPVNMEWDWVNMEVTWDQLVGFARGKKEQCWGTTEEFWDEMTRYIAGQKKEKCAASRSKEEFWENRGSFIPIEGTGQCWSNSLFLQEMETYSTQRMIMLLWRSMEEFWDEMQSFIARGKMKQRWGGMKEFWDEMESVIARRKMLILWGSMEEFWDEMGNFIASGKMEQRWAIMEEFWDEMESFIARGKKEQSWGSMQQFWDEMGSVIVRGKMELHWGSMEQFWDEMGRFIARRKIEQHWNSMEEFWEEMGSFIARGKMEQRWDKFCNEMESFIARRKRKQRWGRMEEFRDKMRSFIARRKMEQHLGSIEEFWGQRGSFIARKRREQLLGSMEEFWGQMGSFIARQKMELLSGPWDSMELNWAQMGRFIVRGKMELLAGPSGMMEENWAEMRSSNARGEMEQRWANMEDISSKMRSFTARGNTEHRWGRMEKFWDEMGSFIARGKMEQRWGSMEEFWHEMRQFCNSVFVLIEDVEFNLANIIVSTQSHNVDVRNAAEEELAQLREQRLNLLVFLLALEFIKIDNSAHTRGLAGFLLKHTLNTSIWFQVNFHVRHVVRILLWYNLSDAHVWRTASEILGVIDSIDCSRNNFDDINFLINPNYAMLLSDFGFLTKLCGIVYNDYVEKFHSENSPWKVAYLYTIGEFCRQMSPLDLGLDRAKSLVNNLIEKMEIFESRPRWGNEICIMATRALCNALDFVLQPCMEMQSDIMVVLCSFLIADKDECQDVIAMGFECLNSIASNNYELLEKYMNDILKATSKALKCDAALQAIKFWSSIARVESKRHTEGKCSPPHSSIILESMGLIIPQVLLCLFRQRQKVVLPDDNDGEESEEDDDDGEKSDEDDDDDAPMNLYIAIRIFLRLAAKTIGNDILALAAWWLNKEEAVKYPNAKSDALKSIKKVLVFCGGIVPLLES